MTIETSAERQKTVTLIIGDESITAGKFLAHEEKEKALALKAVIMTTENPELNRIVSSMIGKNRSLSSVVCESRQLKSVPGYRQEFSSRLAAEASNAGADVNVFANMMYVVTPEYTSLLGRKTMNMHPSVLPEWRGGHPEWKALKSGDPNGLGWTMHTLNAFTDFDSQGRVVKLDNGTVLAHQRVPAVKPYDEALAEKLGKTYEYYEEERIRLAVMMAYAQQAARVVGLLARATPETLKVVRDEQAFLAEGPDRLSFFHSSRFRTLLRQDYDQHLKQEKLASEQYSFEQWLCEEYPGYHRALFLDPNDGQFKTAENLLGITPVAEHADIQPLTKYDICLRGKTFAEVRKMFEALVEIAAGGSNRMHLQSCRGGTENEWLQSEGVLFGSFITTINMTPILSACCDFESTTLRVRVGAEKPIPLMASYREAMLQRKLDEEGIEGLA